MNRSIPGVSVNCLISYGSRMTVNDCALDRNVMYSNFAVIDDGYYKESNRYSAFIEKDPNCVVRPGCTKNAQLYRFNVLQTTFSW